jgi:hypothetical protein
LSRNIHLLFLFLILVTAVVVTPLGAQVLGDEAELERLQTRAEEAIANSDPDTAAMSMGKAALLAGQLARRMEAQAPKYRALEAFLRMQEHAYRALALFTRAGGQPPASSGVCGSLSQADQDFARTKRLLSESRGVVGEEALKQWEATLEGLGQDFQCAQGR